MEGHQRKADGLLTAKMLAETIATAALADKLEAEAQAAR